MAGRREALGLMLALTTLPLARTADAESEEPDTEAMAEDLAEEMERLHGGKWGVHMDPGNGLLVISKCL